MRRPAGSLSIALAVFACSPSAPASSEQSSGFPEIKDIDTLSIRLTRTGCLGACPGYGVEIKGDGLVTYCGAYFVAETGLRSRTVAKSAVLALVDQIKAARFFDLKDEYVAEIYDLAAYQVVVSFDGHSKRVVDYVGHEVGMPKSVTEIENAIDEIAQTKEWVERSPDDAGGAVSEPYPECFKSFRLPIR